MHVWCISWTLKWNVFLSSPLPPSFREPEDEYTLVRSFLPSLSVSHILLVNPLKNVYLVAPTFLFSCYIFVIFLLLFLQRILQDLVALSFLSFVTEQTILQCFFLFYALYCCVNNLYHVISRKYIIINSWTRISEARNRILYTPD